MSGGLSEHEEAVLDAAMGADDAASPAQDDEAVPADGDEIAALRAELREERARRRQLEADLDQYKRDMARRLARLEDQVRGSQSVGSTELEKFATADDDIRATLSANKERAVLLYEHWGEVAWRRDAHDDAQWCVDTAETINAKNCPSKLKHELERLTGEKLAANDIYRTMKQMAKLAGGNETVDEYGRSHIVGGDFEYHERPTPDNRRMKRVLVEVAD